MAFFDVWETQPITELVRRNIEQQAMTDDGGENRAYYGASIAPLIPVQGRFTRIRISDVIPYGLGQFKAPDAVPPLFKTKPTIKEVVYELVMLEEMERFTGEEWIKLNSNDPAIARGAMLDLVDRLTVMQIRNEHLTEKMRWDSFKGVLNVVYPDGGTLTVDYQFAASHLPTAAIPWTDTVNSSPLEDLFAWSQVGADDAGRYYSRVHLNTNTWRLLVRNQVIRSYLSALGRSIMLPTTADMQQLMREGTGNFVILDSGYLPDNATNRRLNKFLPDNRVLLSTEYNLFGHVIADVADGQVLTGGDTGTPPAVNQGFQTELIANPFSKNVFRRVASARMPRLYFPEALLYATVGP